MRRRCLVPIILTAVSVLLLEIGCQKQAANDQTVIDANRPGPRITFEKVVHDFGEVGPGTQQTCEFKFSNTGDSVLEITEIEVCCGVTAESDKQKYAPGESGVLKVQYRVGGQLGSDTKVLYVHSNDWARSKVALTLKAQVVQKIIWEPKALKLALNKANGGCPDITIRSRDGKPFAITAFKSTGDCITAPADRSVEAAEFVLQPKVDLERLQKNLDGHIDIRITHPESGDVAIPFEVLPPFTITPSMIIVFNAKPREPMATKLLIINNYGEDFEVESTSSKNGFVRVLAQKQIRNGYQFELEVTPPDAKGRTNFSDEFLVDIKGRDGLAITCRGFY